MKTIKIRNGNKILQQIKDRKIIFCSWNFICLLSSPFSFVLCNFLLEVVLCCLIVYTERINWRVASTDFFFIKPLNFLKI
jgi:hypothetical protein